MDKIIAYFIAVVILVGLGYAWRYSQSSDFDLYRSGLKTGEGRIIWFLSECSKQNNTLNYSNLRCVPRTDGRVTVTIYE